MDAWLPLLAPGLPSRLVSEEALGRVNRVAAGLPWEVGLSRFGLECDLSDPEPRADFLVSFTRRDGNAAALARVASTPPTPAPLPADVPTPSDSPWSGIASLARAWTTPDGVLRGRIDDVWLEFDLPPGGAGTAGDTSLPSIFFGTVHDSLEGPFPWAFYAPSMGPAFDMLLGPRIFAQLRPAVTPLLDRLPPFARIFQAGAMLSRPIPGLRLCVGFLTPPRVVSTFRALSLPVPEDLEPRLAWLASTAALITLDLDVTPEGLLPRVGVEWHGPDQHLCHLGPAVTGLLGDLVHLGAALPDRVEALAAWPGSVSSLDDPTGWPRPLDVPGNLVVRARVSHLVRRVNHLKVVFEPGLPPRAKAYLAVDFAWRPLVRTAP